MKYEKDKFRRRFGDPKKVANLRFFVD